MNAVVHPQYGAFPHQGGWNPGWRGVGGEKDGEEQEDADTSCSGRHLCKSKKEAICQLFATNCCTCTQTLEVTSINIKKSLSIDLPWTT